MRAPSFRSLMQRLALAATFALALVPTFGRLAQGIEAPAMRDAWGAMCTVAGLTVDDTAAHGAHAPAAPAPHHVDDCPYCPLLQGLVEASAPAFDLAQALPAAPVLPARLPTARFEHPTGLRSRGPPSVS